MELCEHSNKKDILSYARLGNSLIVLGLCLTNVFNVFNILFLNFKFYVFKNRIQSHSSKVLKVQKGKRFENLFLIPVPGRPVTSRRQPMLLVSCVSFQIVHISANTPYSMQIVEYHMSSPFS